MYIYIYLLQRHRGVREMIHPVQLGDWQPIIRALHTYGMMHTVQLGGGILSQTSAAVAADHSLSATGRGILSHTECCRQIQRFTQCNWEHTSLCITIGNLLRIMCCDHRRFTHANKGVERTCELKTRLIYRNKGWFIPDAISPRYMMISVSGNSSHRKGQRIRHMPLTLGTQNVPSAQKSEESTK